MEEVKNVFRAACLSVTMAACIFFATGCAKKTKQVVRVPSTPAPASSSAPASSGGTKQSAKKTVAPLPIGYTEEGIASWYGIPYHGRKAADGETYDMETLVAAHRVMPFNTWLKVTNLSNNKIVTVRIIDRGPFVDNRIIDLSKAAARQIELLGPGIGPVRLEVIAAPVDIPADDFYAVQVGVFSVLENAERLRVTLERRFGSAKVVPMLGTSPRWRVLAGKEPTVEGAQSLADTLKAENRDVFVTRLDEKLPTPAPQPPPAVIETNKIWQTPANVTFDPREGSTTLPPSPNSQQRPPQ